MPAVGYAALGTGFCFLMTALGSALVFLMRWRNLAFLQRIMLGFAAGVMIAASIWSLLVPAMEQAQQAGTPGWLPAGGGFVLGVGFMVLIDVLLPHLHAADQKAEGLTVSWRRTTMLVSAVTLHNIPEGMAAGLAFALAAQHPDQPALFTAAFALAAGMGIQNFPEGAAISLPLLQEGVSRRAAFGLGAISGAVEPIFGIAAVLAAGLLAPIMPWLLAFAAGAMMFVVVEDLIPAAHLGQHGHAGTLGVMAGFLVMMILDVVMG